MPWLLKSLLPKLGNCNSKVSLPRGTGYGGTEDDMLNIANGLKIAEERRSCQEKSLLEIMVEADAKFRNWIQAEDGKELTHFLPSTQNEKLEEALKEVFQNFTEWDERKQQELIEAALNLLSTILSDGQLVSIFFGDRAEQSSSLLSILRALSDQTLLIADKSLEINQDKESGSDCKSWQVLCRIQKDVSMAITFLHIKNEAERALFDVQGDKDETIASVLSHEEQYKMALGKDRVDFIDDIGSHSYEIESKLSNSNRISGRLYKELVSYKQSLPVEYGSSIFVRVCSSRFGLLRALIIGPDDTPYANGCFFFDIYVQPDYPQTAPLVKFLTTGGGRVCLNLNLYEDGKVCLSLLGTWSGPGWNPAQSTLLQVLLSIQSLIFVPEPYFNEPGYEEKMGTPTWDKKSKQYNLRVEKDVLDYAIVDSLKGVARQQDGKVRDNVYSEFASVISTHFALKKPVIEKQLKHLQKRMLQFQLSVQRCMVLLEANYNLNTRGGEFKRRKMSLPALTHQITDPHTSCNSTQVSDFTPLSSDLTIFALSDSDDEFEYSYSESDYDDGDYRSDHKDEEQTHEPESGKCLRELYLLLHLDFYLLCVPLSWIFFQGIIFSLMNSIDLIPELKRIKSEVCEILNVKSTTSLQLLKRYDWNKESLIDAYTSNAGMVGKKGGGNGKFNNLFSRSRKIKSSYCSSGHNDLMSDDKMMEDFIKSNYGWRCCPGAGCNRVAVLSRQKQLTDIGGNEVSASVSCDTCNTSFCIKCGEEPHAPITCHYLSKWKERCKVPPNSEGAFGKWVFTEKRPCPVCRQWIERKHGHSHVTCQQCKYEVCWLCMNPWHGYGTSKRICRLSFVPIFPTITTTGMSDQEFYIHCHSRFKAHNHSQKVAEEFKEKVLAELGKGTFQKELLVLNEANILLVKCRLFLKYSFAFGYYHFDSFETIRRRNFEHHQQILETFTEHLQEMTANPFNEINEKDILNKVNENIHSIIALSRICS